MYFFVKDSEYLVYSLRSKQNLKTAKLVSCILILSSRAHGAVCQRRLTVSLR